MADGDKHHEQIGITQTASTFRQQDELVLVCEICQNSFDKSTEFRQPVVLPCFHTFCRGCITQIEEENRPQGGFTCRRCDAPCRTPASQLPIDFVRLADIEADSVSSGKVQLVCQECEDEDDATYHCQDCPLLLCDRCRDQHKRAKKTKSHKASTIAEYKASLKDRQQVIPREKRMCKSAHFHTGRMGQSWHY